MGRFHIAILGLTAALSLLVTPVSAFEFPSLRQPDWQELSLQQKQILAPLSDEWNSMDDDRRRKWLGIAARYPHLSREEQGRIQGQMGEWARLTPQQKQAIRAKYRALLKASPQARAAMREQWEKYQELPEEEKQRLQAEAARKKAEAQQRAREKSRHATSVLSAKSLRPGYPSIPAQQAPAPVTTIAPAPVPAPAIAPSPAVEAVPPVEPPPAQTP